MSLCNSVIDYREAGDLQSGRRANGVTGLRGFRQANSKQEIRKSAEQRDNDIEIRDQLTPSPGYRTRLLTDYDFLLLQRAHTMEHRQTQPRIHSLTYSNQPLSPFPSLKHIHTLQSCAEIPPAVRSSHESVN